MISTKDIEFLKDEGVVLEHRGSNEIIGYCLGNVIEIRKTGENEFYIVGSYEDDEMFFAECSLDEVGQNLKECLKKLGIGF